MKSDLNRELIENLNESSNENFAETVNGVVYSLVEDVVNEVSLISPFVRSDKCVLVPANEIYLGAFSQLSEYTYFFGIDNAQMEINSKSKSQTIKYLWREFRASWRIGRKKKYKKVKEKERSIESLQRYSLADLRHDLVMALADRVSETSVITEYSNHISLFGADDFGTGVMINIYICFYDSNTGVFGLPKANKNKLIQVNFGNRFRNLDNKLVECGPMFVNMAKIYNALYSKNYDKVPNQILLESLLYNCPTVLFDENDVYKTFVNVSNYIRLTNPKSFVSICDESKNIFEENLVDSTNAQIDFGKIINMLDRYKY